MKSLRSQFFAACLMGLYCLIGTPIASVVFVALAQCSDEHEIQVHGMDGSLRVVLHHPKAGVTTRPGDHKAGVAKALTCLCGVNPDGDHVFVEAAPTASLSQASARSYLRVSAMPVVLITPCAPMFGLERVATDAISVLRGQNHAPWRSNKPQASMGTIALLV